MPEKRDASFFKAYITRHSKAHYKDYGRILKGEKPTGPFKHEEQQPEGLELTEAGIALAHEKAEKFFDQLDPQRDQLFFVTSNEARAIETADIYREAAKKRGFEIIKPEHPRSELAQRIGEGELRVIQSLSLNTENLLRFLVFSGSAPEVNWEAVDEGTKKRWQEARRIIEEDNKGSWGANFAVHSEQVKDVFPGVETAKQFYETKFKNLTRLLKWADQKVQAYREKSGQDKDVKVLAFGHEDYLVKFLRDEFTEEGIQNCEAIKLEVGEGKKVTALFRGKTRTLGEGKEAPRTGPNYEKEK